MLNFKTAFGSEVTIANGSITFIDENSVQQNIPLSSIKSVEDNIKHQSQNQEVISRNRKYFVSIMKGIIALLGIIIIYKFINPEVIERIRGGYVVEEISYATPIFLLILVFCFIITLFAVKFAVNKTLEKSSNLEQNDLQNKKDWTLTIKAEKNGALMPFQVCKGHVSEIRHIKQSIQSGN